jgi:hypothetical protein
MNLSNQSKSRPSMLPKGVRALAIRAGRTAKAEALKKRGATADDGARAYRRAYNGVRAAHLYAFDADYRKRNQKAGAKWRAKVAAQS